MIEINIPRYRKLRLKHIVLDYNDTIACDGELIAGVKENLTALADKLQVHILTADIVCTHIVSALELLKNPLRLIAALRS